MCEWEMDCEKKRREDRWEILSERVRDRLIERNGKRWGSRG